MLKRELREQHAGAVSQPDLISVRRFHALEPAERTCQTWWRVNKFLRTAPTRRLLTVILATVAVIAAGATLAIAAAGNGPVPARKGLAQAITARWLPQTCGESAPTSSSAIT